LIKVRAFIKPEDLFYASAYLLFSDERTHERKHVNTIEQAFLGANLMSRRLFVQKEMIFLECRGYVASATLDRYNSPADNFFTRVFADAIVRIPAGKIPPKIGDRDANSCVYEFKPVSSD
jgi:hypothetical protein